jgi:hypothetical protein
VRQGEVVGRSSRRVSQVNQDKVAIGKDGTARERRAQQCSFG